MLSSISPFRHSPFVRSVFAAKGGLASGVPNEALSYPQAPELGRTPLHVRTCRLLRIAAWEQACAVDRNRDAIHMHEDASLRHCRLRRPSLPITWPAGFSA